MRPFLIMKTGTTVDNVRAWAGDFEDWFAAALGNQTPTLVVDCTRESPPSGPAAYTGVIITGSAAMVTRREAWSERTGEWLRDAVVQGVPILAVCYGHQLLAQAMGGTVGSNPNGRQIGSKAVHLTAAGEQDTLFSSLPKHFIAQTSHLESVITLPENAVRLASMDADENYAFRLGENAWCVQFHPEFSADITRGYITARSDLITAEGQDPDGLYARVEESPQAHALIRKFADLAKKPLLRAS